VDNPRPLGHDELSTGISSVDPGTEGRKNRSGMAILRNFAWKKGSRFWDDGALGEVSCDGPSGHRPEWIFGSSICSCFLGRWTRTPKVLVLWEYSQDPKSSCGLKERNLHTARALNIPRIPAHATGLADSGDKLSS
jgi:hypothetical protein